ncbi:MAG: hypothetical protein RR198_04025 [Oscillospiraceae bacterium]
MDKWYYIKLISKRDMLIDLMDWAGVINTQEVTFEQAKSFYESLPEKE